MPPTPEGTLLGPESILELAPIVVESYLHDTGILPGTDCLVPTSTVDTLRELIAFFRIDRSAKRTAFPTLYSTLLRHTYASLMLQQGESIVYVQRQLEHATIQSTVDTYGKWVPRGNKAAVDRLDGEIGSNEYFRE